MQNNLRDDVLKLCAEIGGDSLLVQGSGGNVSWKDNDLLWVKASGTRLREALIKDIFVSVELKEILNEISTGNFSATPKVIGNSQLRPSIETVLHAIMPHKVVVHLHAVEILSNLVRRDSDYLLESALAQVRYRWAVVEYLKPGEALARAVKEVLVSTPSVSVIFLKNHGVVIGAENTLEVLSILFELTTLLTIKPVNFLATNPIVKTLPLYNYREISNNLLSSLVIDPFLFESLKKAWCLYPDHVVFLGRRPYVFDSWGDFKSNFPTQENIPELIFIKSEGCFVTPQFNQTKFEQLECFFNVLIRQKPEQQIKVLDEFETDQLLNWDAEKYRQNLAG